jgi:aminobenzoyl-glutamate transport protein
MFSSVIENFVRFPPFGLVLVAMVGIGVADGSGLIEAMLKHVVLRAPKRIVTAVVVAAGILSHLGSSVGYVVLIPLGAMVFLAFGRHPVAGIAAAFVGVSGGFGANFFIGSVDPILAGMSETAAQIISPGTSVNPAVNFYFMLASAFMVVIVGTLVTERIVEPRLGSFRDQSHEVEHLSEREIKGVRYAFLGFIAVCVAFLILVVPESGLLHGQTPLLERPFAQFLNQIGYKVEIPPAEASVLKGPFFKGIVTAMLVLFMIPGLVYGLYVGTIRSDRDFMAKVVESMKGLAPYIVLVFFAAQFVFYFKKSNLGIILAIQGAELIKSVGVSGVSLMIIFVLFSATMNMFMGSASAKCAIMAPVFVPMFMLSGYHPALTQAAFRIGDSVTNIITPMMSYFALILTFIEKYDKKAGIGTLIATMLPYTIVLTIAWIALLAVWYVFGLPLGPGGPLHF